MATKITAAQLNELVQRLNDQLRSMREEYGKLPALRTHADEATLAALKERQAALKIAHDIHGNALAAHKAARDSFKKHEPEQVSKHYNDVLTLANAIRDILDAPVEVEKSPLDEILDADEEPPKSTRFSDRMKRPIGRKSSSTDKS